MVSLVVALFSPSSWAEEIEYREECTEERNNGTQERQAEACYFIGNTGQGTDASNLGYLHKCDLLQGDILNATPQIFFRLCPS